MSQPRRNLNELDFLQDEVGGWYYINSDGTSYSGILFETYANSVLAYEGEYQSGYKMGIQHYWHENGQLKEKSFSCWDNPHGSCKAWNEKGTLVFEAEYKYGIRVWSKKYSDEENLMEEYRIDNHPQELVRLNVRISTLKKRIDFEKWDAALQGQADE